MHRNKKKKFKNNVFFFYQAVTFNSIIIKVHSRQCLFDSVDNRNDLVTRIVAVCEQIPPEFLLRLAFT
jgi:hypothetical protein